GHGLFDQETIPSRLAERLSSMRPASSFAVYNFACPNHFSVQERIRLEQLLLHGHVPRIAVFTDGFDEFLWPYYAPLMLRPLQQAIPRASTSQLVARALRALWRRLLAGGDGDAEDAGGVRGLPDPATVVQNYLTNKRLVEAACRSFSVQPLFVWQPVPCYHY